MLTWTRSVVNVYFRHQRGTALAIYSTIYTLATVAGATFCGFIVQHSTWPVNFWWLTAGNALAAVLVFLFLEETGYDRMDGEVAYGASSRSWVQGRIATFLPGSKVVVHRVGAAGIVRAFLTGSVQRF